MTPDVNAPTEKNSQLEERRGKEKKREGEEGENRKGRKEVLGKAHLGAPRPNFQSLEGKNI